MCGICEYARKEKSTKETSEKKKDNSSRKK
jgi:hypothetical protein